ncbi:UDP-glucuronate 4-epimerase 6 [Acorus calamus]|uniref:UDP-glucuronate 4-epimerase 6 n=1 Tax=Acorus calamus TaxID=4465 RepID=A0AAV9F111_ACOCL|nr:UDP-glucuronate 4-epimerase 6 [Acorus calamus]
MPTNFHTLEELWAAGKHLKHPQDNSVKAKVTQLPAVAWALWLARNHFLFRDTSKTTKLERYNSYLRRVNSTKLLSASSKLLFRATLLISLLLLLFFTLNYPPLSDLSSSSSTHRRLSFLSSALSSSSSFGGPTWERQVRHSATPRRPSGLSVLVTGAAGFVGSHASLALRKRGDGVLGLDNFNHYYDVSLKRARQDLLRARGVHVVEGDLNDSPLLSRLFDVVPFTHVLHLAAQAGVRYAMKNPQSYVASNVAGFISLLEVAKSADPQPAIVWASSSSDDKEVARDFTYIDDVVKGCLGALDTAEKSTGSGGKKREPAQLRVYNLGNTSPVPVGRLVSILEGLLGVKAKKHIIRMPRNGDVPYTHANVSLAGRDFGYRPTTDIAVGLRKFVKWYIGYYGIQSKVNKLHEGSRGGSDSK